MLPRDMGGSRNSYSMNQVQDLNKNQIIIQKWPIWFTWKLGFDAFVLKLLDCKASDASFAELLYLRERPCDLEERP